MADIRIHAESFAELLRDNKIREELTRRMAPVLEQAISTAPVRTGAYRDSIHLVQATTDRVAVRVVADSPHAMAVEARTGNLARALDAAGGENHGGGHGGHGSAGASSMKTTPDGHVIYTTKAGKVRTATPAQAAAWGKGRGR